MFGRVRAWFDERRRKQRAIDRAVDRAVDAFRRSRDVPPMGAHVLRIDDDGAVVRVMYLTTHIPPDRAWFAVPSGEGPVRELTFDDVASLEVPWR